MSNRNLPSAADATAPVLASIRAGEDVALPDGSSGRAMLDRVEAGLEGEFRVVRVVAGPSGLSLSGFMAQVAGDADLAGQDDSVLEVGYRRLAVPDQPGQRIALMIDGAGRLQRAALRFVQHVSRSAPALVLVVTGGADLDGLLADPDFAALRTRLAAAQSHLASDGHSQAELRVARAVDPSSGDHAAAPEAASVRERVSTVSARRRRAPIWAVAGLGMAASVAVAGWVARGALDQEPPPVAAEKPPVAAETAQLTPPPVPAQPERMQQALAEPAPAPAQSAPSRQEAMLTPQPVLAAPAFQPSPEPDHTGPRPAPKAADAHRRETTHASVRASHAARPRLPEFDRAPPAWEDQRPRPVFSGPVPRFWGRPHEVIPYDPPTAEGPYIGTYAADGYGMRTFHYGR